MRLVFLKHAEIDKLNKGSIDKIKSLYARKKLINRIGFETILGKIKQKKPEDTNVYKHGVNIDGECIFDPELDCLGEHFVEYNKFNENQNKITFSEKINEFRRIKECL